MRMPAKKRRIKKMPRSRLQKPFAGEEAAATKAKRRIKTPRSGLQKPFVRETIESLSTIAKRLRDLVP
jgi:hypothetical protein